MRKNEKVKQIVKTFASIMVAISYIGNTTLATVAYENAVKRERQDMHRNNACVYASKTNIQAKNKNIISKIKPLYEADDIMAGIMYELDNDTVIYENIYDFGKEYNSEGTFFSKKVNLDVEKCNINDIIVSERDITVKASKLESSKGILCSKNGNITINSTNINMAGII